MISNQSNTSRSDTVIAILEALNTSGIRWAVLHDESRLASGLADSDIDVVADRKPAAVFRRVLPRLMSTGLCPFLIVPNDLVSVSLFVLSPDRKTRVDLDVTCDPAGRGKYGLRSGRVLERAVKGTRWPCLSPEDTLIYQINKKLTKGEWEEATALVRTMRTDDVAAGLSRAPVILRGRRRVQRVIKGLKGECDAPASELHGAWASLRTQLRQVALRAVQPVGYWVHIADGAGSLAERLLAALEHAFPYSRAIELGSAGGFWRSGRVLREIVAVRLRPALAISTGRLGRGLKPDLVLPKEAAHPDAVLDALSARVLRQLGDT